MKLEFLSENEMVDLTGLYEVDCSGYSFCCNYAFCSPWGSCLVVAFDGKILLYLHFSAHL